MSDPHDVTRLLSRAVESVDPDLDRLVAGGRVRGVRRARRSTIRRTTVRVGGPLAVAAAVAAVLVTAVPHPSSAPAAVEPAVQRAADASPPVTADDAGTAPAVPTPKGPQPVPATPSTQLTNQAAVQILADLLPSDGTTSGLAGPRAATDTAQGWLRYRSGAQTAKIAAYVVFRSDLDTRCIGLDDGEVCTSEQRPDGSTLMTRKDPAAGYWSATTVRKDAFMVMVSEQLPVPASSGYPVNMAQLVAIATDRTWQPTVDVSFAERAAGLFEPTPAPAWKTGTPNG